LGLESEMHLEMLKEQARTMSPEWFQRTPVVKQYYDLAHRVLERVKAEKKPASKSSVPTVKSSSDVDIVHPARVKRKRRAYAVVLGIEQYREKLPKADFADRDAQSMREYLTKILGYPEENVVVRVNEKAARTDLEKYIEGWLPNNVEKDSSVFVYYSGHGTPHAKSGDAYLVPYDGDLTFIEKTGYPLKRLYAALDKLPVNDVTVVLDSCFSGAGGRSVLAEGARPMVLSVKKILLAHGKTVVLAASADNQLSITFKDKGHGLLTYYFLKGLRGEGDLNKGGTQTVQHRTDSSTAGKPRGSQKWWRTVTGNIPAIICRSSVWPSWSIDDLAPLPHRAAASMSRRKRPLRMFGFVRAIPLSPLFFACSQPVSRKSLQIRQPADDRGQTRQLQGHRAASALVGRLSETPRT